MPLATTRTDRRGRFTLDLEHGNRVRLVVVKDGFVPLHVRTVRSAHTNHHVRLHEAKKLTISIRDRSGNAIPGASVAVHIATQMPDVWGWFLPPVVTGTCDKEGHFRFQLAGPRHTLTLFVRAPGYQPRQIDVPEVTQDGDR